MDASFYYCTRITEFEKILFANGHLKSDTVQFDLCTVERKTKFSPSTVDIFTFTFAHPTVKPFLVLFLSKTRITVPSSEPITKDT